jgi:hypothetical protein
MKMVIRGGQFFDPSPQLEPADPFPRYDRDDVGLARPAGAPALLHEDQTEQARLAQRVLDGGAGATGERGDGVDVQGADSSPLTLPSDHAENGELAHREGGGDLRRDDSAHGLAAPALERGLTIWGARAFGGPRKPKGWPRGRYGPSGREGGSTGLQGFADGLGLGVEDLTLGVRPPRQAGDLVNGSGISGGSCGRCELVGEHRFSVRDRGPAEGARTLSSKAPLRPKMGLRRIAISGSIRTATSLDTPRLCRDTGPPLWRVLCFWASIAPCVHQTGPIRPIRLESPYLHAWASGGLLLLTDALK